MTVIHHTCEGFQRFVLPEDTVTVDISSHLGCLDKQSDVIFV